MNYLLFIVALLMFLFTLTLNPTSALHEIFTAILYLSSLISLAAGLLLTKGNKIEKYLNHIAKLQKEQIKVLRSIKASVVASPTTASDSKDKEEKEIHE